MVIFERVSREEMARRYGERRPRVTVPAASATKMLNIQQVLDLSNLVFFTFRGRAYGVPPLPYKAGQQLSSVAMELQKYVKGLTVETFHGYHDLIKTLPRLFRRYSRPVGYVRRCRWRLRLMRNPYERATETELGELLNFFLRCRTRSGVQFPGDMPPHPPRPTA